MSVRRLADPAIQPASFAFNRGECRMGQADHQEISRRAGSIRR